MQIRFPCVQSGYAWPNCLLGSVVPRTAWAQLFSYHKRIQFKFTFSH